MDKQDDNKEHSIEDLDAFLTYIHEYAYWYVKVTYLDIPPLLKNFYIDSKINESPVPKELLYEFIDKQEVNQIASEYITKNMTISNANTGKFILRITTRIDWGYKLQLVDDGMADLCWDPEKQDFVVLLNQKGMDSVKNIHDKKDQQN